MPHRIVCSPIKSLFTWGKNCNHHLGFVDRCVGSCIRFGVPSWSAEIIELKGLVCIFFTVQLERSQEVMLFHPCRKCCCMSLSSLLPSSLFPFLFLLLLLLLHRPFPFCQCSTIFVILSKCANHPIDPAKCMNSRHLRRNLPFFYRTHFGLGHKRAQQHASTSMGKTSWRLAKRPSLSWSVVQTISTGCSSVGLRNVEAIALQRLWARLVLKRFFGMPKKNRRTQSQECSDTIWKAYKKQKRWNIWPYSRVSSFLGGDTSNFMSFCRIQNSLPSTESLQPSFQFNLHAFGSFSGCTAIRVGTPKPRLYSSKHIPMFSCMVFRWFQCTVASLLGNPQASQLGSSRTSVPGHLGATMTTVRSFKHPRQRFSLTIPE